MACDLRPGSGRCECAGCGRCFGSETAFSRHQRLTGDRHNPTLVCLDPATVGLTLNLDGWWVRPVPKLNGGVTRGAPDGRGRAPPPPPASGATTASANIEEDGEMDGTTDVEREGGRTGRGRAPEDRTADAAAGNDDGTTTVTLEDGRRLTIDEDLDSLHHHPGEPIPDWWEACPVCAGTRCPRCDGTGRIHPKRAKWFADAVGFATIEYAILERLRAGGRLPVGRGHEALLVLGNAAGALQGRWADEDPDLAAAIAAVVADLG